jgi:lipopolysaccharide/colanic/teichoic acid biosynthesis glycosyltransferase
MLGRAEIDVSEEDPIKRSLDVLIAVGMIVACLPILLFVAAWIKLDSAGGILYRSMRIGRYGKPFRMLKFRTMVVDAEELGGPSTPDDDPRLTRAGKRLRRFNLDELPQLFNVLKGDMSLVGPRPEVPSEVATYTEEQRLLLSVRPGMTDYASIKFNNEGEIIRGAEDPHKAYKELIQPEKIRLGLEYVQDHSLLTDLRIVLATAASIFRRNRVK